MVAAADQAALRSPPGHGEADGPGVGERSDRPCAQPSEERSDRRSDGRSVGWVEKTPTGSHRRVAS